MTMTLRMIFATARSDKRYFDAFVPHAGVKALLLTLLVLPLYIGCATTPEPIPAFEAYQPTDVEESPGYETPPHLMAVDVVPPELMSGPNFVLDPRVVNDGYTNHYLVKSDFGEFPAAGRTELEERVEEVRAIAVLREMNRREAYGKGVVAGAKRTALTPVRQVKRYVDDPKHLILVVPGEAMRVVGIAQDVSKLVRMGLTKAYLKNLIGFDDAKKGLAKRLNVDPGSPNPVLQADLNSAAWPYYGGSAPMYLLEEFMPLVPIPHLTLVEGGESAGDAIDVYENEIGRKSVRTQLRKMGVAKVDRKALKKHPAYSSRDRKNLVWSLYRVDDATGRESFVRHALRAESPTEARAIVHQAQTIAVYDQTYDEIVEMAEVDDTVLCYTKSGVVVMPLYADYVAWTEDFARRVEAMMTWRPERGPVAAREIWIAGEVTPWAQEELVARSVAVHEHATDELQQAVEELENSKNGIIARFRRNKAGRALERLAEAAER